jgi:AcrR family transcriptional regulator
MPRPYVQAVRADAASARRSEILDTAIAMLRDDRLPGITLNAVATRSGVARSTVYLQFGSRSGLFEAVAERLLERIDFASLVTATSLPDPLEALHAAMAESVRLYAAERDAARALWSWAELDPDAGRAIEVLDGGRARGTRHLVTRLAKAGLLSDRISVAAAADVLYLLTSFDSFDNLYTDRQLDEAQVTARLTLLLGSILSSPVPEPPRARNSTRRRRAPGT